MLFIMMKQMHDLYIAGFSRNKQTYNTHGHEVSRKEQEASSYYQHFR